MRTPDLIIGPRDNPQTLRWHIFRWRGWQLSLHKWLRSDDDRAPHDHKADSWSFILWGAFLEHIFLKHVYLRTLHVSAGQSVFRSAELPHRIELIEGKPVWTLWLRKPPCRRWGYWCANRGWVPAEDYNKQADYYAEGISEVGRGCD